jgi:LAO/AO transport system kinase
VNKNQSSKAALRENEGVSEQESTNKNAISNLKRKRQEQPSVEELLKGILKSNTAALSRGITLIESQNLSHKSKANALIQNCLEHTKPSVRIGITGVPGVGKSTYIEALGTYLTNLGNKVAVLAVDPSSSLSKGSILGDKTRMDVLVRNPNAFIRPSAAGESLGGVARHTREAITLCEAAGYDVILIETVGVGQSETSVHSMVDFFLLLKLAGAGDELQGIKRGIIEMADAIIINKADGNNKNAAKLAMLEFKRALHLYPAKASNWIPKVIMCSALKQIGIEESWTLIKDYLDLAKSELYFTKKRQEQNMFWLIQSIENQLKDQFFKDSVINKEMESQIELINNNKRSPFAAAEYLLNLQKTQS